MKLAKLITECNVAVFIKGDETLEMLTNFVLKPCVHELINKLASSIVNAKLEEGHYLRILMQVHAHQSEEGLV